MKSKVNNKGKILAVDFGEKNVGLAESDISRELVFPAGVISDYRNIDNLIGKLVELCNEKDFSIIVFGLPKAADGNETEQTLRYRKLGMKLFEGIKASKPDILFEFEDESFSTFDGRSIDAKLTDHEKAAMKILERYLNK